MTSVTQDSKTATLDAKLDVILWGCWFIMRSLSVEDNTTVICNGLSLSKITVIQQEINS
ncbi:hypothetical protein [Pseudanabaena sp. lw0831]|uniref:hypothetical protein n=1 Tax=Pseudanabaena sp. lw0831 TaxID=1357935 RepID=UPI001F41F346|nr:hypothetical protein [Pseudanabaena sp. lw0831]